MVPFETVNQFVRYVLLPVAAADTSKALYYAVIF